MLQPNPGDCIVFDGDCKHASAELMSGERFVLVGFYNADGGDCAGRFEEQQLGKRASEQANKLEIVETVYISSVVATSKQTRPGCSAFSRTLPCFFGSELKIR